MIDRISDMMKQGWVENLILRFDLFQPACETAHFLGLALLLGTVGLLDLRLLGVARSVPIGAFQRFVPWGVFGFGVCLVSGLLIMVGDPFREPSWYMRNIGYQLKMLLILLAGVNVVLFYVTGLAKQVDQLAPGEDAPRGAKIIAGLSLIMWIGVMYFGRMLPWEDALYMVFENPEDWG